MNAALEQDSNELRAMVARVSSIIAEASGNQLGEKQKGMVETRLRRRMIQLGCQNVNQYDQYLTAHLQEETQALLSLLTTHHSFFFREFSHFTLLKQHFQALSEAAKKRGDNCINIWSAACSRGQEVYSLAMFFDYYLSKRVPGMTFKVFGSDVDPKSVKFASNGVYNKNELKEVPISFLGNHWAKGKEAIQDFVKAKNSLSQYCKFKPINLLNIPKNLPKFDVIFCRNVFIYFNDGQVKEIATNLIDHLHEGGMLFSGISESLGHFKLKVKTVGPAVYQKPLVVTSSSQSSKLEAKTTPKKTLSVAPKQEKLRVLCVDDSPPVLTLMKKLFASDTQFEVVGTAGNGIEAKEAVAKLKPDLMTLDIHMPEMDGLTYLRNNYSGGHPPVVMVSSASREDSEVAIKALELGASDFVEKPALNNLAKKGEELKTKLLVAHEEKSGGRKKLSSFDSTISKKILVSDVDSKLRLILSSLGSIDQLVHFFRELPGPRPPSVILFEGNEVFLDAAAEKLSSRLHQPVELLSEHRSALNADGIYFGLVSKELPALKSELSNRKTSFMLFGRCLPETSQAILQLNGIQVLVEDLGKSTDSLGEVASDVVPVTSFPYLSNKFFSED